MILFILQIADVLTTWYILFKLGGREVNPVMRYGINKLGFWPSMGLKVLLVSLIGLYVSKVALAYYILVAVYVVVVCWNVKEMIRHE